MNYLALKAVLVFVLSWLVVFLLASGLTGLAAAPRDFGLTALVALIVTAVYTAPTLRRGRDGTTTGSNP